MSSNDNQERLTTFLAQSTVVVSLQLQARFGVEPAAADEMARDIVHDICAECGPAYIYVPKDGSFELSKRDREIFEKYKGYNLHSLAREYGVSHVRIRQIHAKMLAEEKAKRQAVLPGLDA